MISAKLHLPIVYF